MSCEIAVGSDRSGRSNCTGSGDSLVCREATRGGAVDVRDGSAVQSCALGDTAFHAERRVVLSLVLELLDSGTALVRML